MAGRFKPKGGRDGYFWLDEGSWGLAARARENPAGLDGARGSARDRALQRSYYYGLKHRIREFILWEKGFSANHTSVPTGQPRWDKAMNAIRAFKAKEAERAASKDNPPGTSNKRSVRPSVARSGSDGVVREGSTRPARGHLPLSVKPPKNNAPGAQSTDRLGVFGKRSSSGGGLFGSFGRPGAGMQGSYQLRSGQAIASNLKGRLRLSSAGYAAILVSQIVQGERRSLDDAVEKAGTPGGFMALSRREQLDWKPQGSTTDRTKGRIGSVLRRSAGTVAGVAVDVSGALAEILLLAANSITGNDDLGDRIVNASAIVNGEVNDRIDAWIAGEPYVSKQQKKYKEAATAQYKYHAEQEKMYQQAKRRYAHDLGKSGVSGVTGSTVDNFVNSDDTWDRWRDSMEREWKRLNPEQRDALERGAGPKE